MGPFSPTSPSASPPPPPPNHFPPPLQSLIEKLESSSPRVIAARRRDYFRALIPDYDSIKKSIVGVAARKRTTFEESIVVLTQDNHAKLQVLCINVLNLET